MVGASSRLLSLLTNPTSLLHHRPFALFRLAHRHSFTFSLATLSTAAPNHLLRPNSLIPLNFSQSYFSRATNNASLQENSYIPANDHHVAPSHPWPEWSRLLESLSAAGYYNVNSNIEDEFVTNENLSMEFVAAANSCLAFARHRPDILGWLPRKDIEMLINDGYPFLFKSAHETERRMRSFLQGLNEARSVDLMKYILSYVSNPIIYPERNINKAIESSVRSLLQEMTNLSYRTQTSEQFHTTGRDEQMPRNLGPNITMKRGDWVCPKCSFMNFARNTKCLECEEVRPQRQLADGEWDCPQCNFFNYRRNTVCLKCECRRPSEHQNNYGDNVNNNFRPTNKNLERSFDHNREQFHGNNSSDSGIYSKNINRGQNERSSSSSSYVPFVPLPADMFAKKMVNEHSEEATLRSSEWSEKSTTYVQSNHIQEIDKEDKTERWFKKVKELHGVTEPISTNTSHEDGKKKKDQSFSPYEKQHTMHQQSSSSFTPFVPFPPNYFNKKDELSSRENSNDNILDKNVVQGSVNQHMDSRDANNEVGHTPETLAVGQRPPESMNVKSGWNGKSLEGSAVTETDPLDMSEEAKAERWFRRVAQIKDISELSQIPDEDFPSIMPMRKGVNRFVVSKRKTPLERRLTSPQYRKNLRIMSSDPMKKEGEDDN